MFSLFNLQQYFISYEFIMFNTQHVDRQRNKPIVVFKQIFWSKSKILLTKVKVKKDEYVIKTLSTTGKNKPVSFNLYESVESNMAVL